MSARPKSEELQELADLCTTTTAQGLRRIAVEHKHRLGDDVRHVFEVVEWLNLKAGNSFARMAIDARASEARERRLQHDVASYLVASDAIDAADVAAIPDELVERIIQRVRKPRDPEGA